MSITIQILIIVYLLIGAWIATRPTKGDYELLPEHWKMMIEIIMFLLWLPITIWVLYERQRRDDNG